MPLPNITKPKVTIANKDLEAWLRLPELGEDEDYTIEYLHDVLKANRVIYGIDEDELRRALEQRLFDTDILAAKGTMPTEGTDGYYQYMVNMEEQRKPKIRPDGSVDYWSMYSVKSVQKGQVIAVYHPAVQGKDGKGVSGAPIPPKPAREQPALRGVGFERGEDNLTYVSSIDGKIDIKDDKIRILPIYEMSNDVNLTVGDIDFTGDIVIHGAVESGVSIKATGSITIDGAVEACHLEAGKDIILRSGMAGGNKASIHTKGNLTAKFIEYASIEADGNIQADILLNCRVFCKGSVTVEGKTAKIIGGDVRAVKFVKAANIGNNAEVKTFITAGVGKDYTSRAALLKRKCDITREELNKIELGLKKFEQMEKERGVSYHEDPRRVALLRSRIKDMALLANDEAEIKRLEEMIHLSRNAKVSVPGTVYAGTVICIGDERLEVKNNAKGVEFYNLDSAIRTRPAAN